MSIYPYLTIAVVGGAVGAYAFIAGRRSPRRQYLALVADELAKQPLLPKELLTEADIAHLPAFVRRYIGGSGAIGKPKVQNARVTLDAQMQKKPGSAPMKAMSEQYNFFGNPARLFFMKASMFGIPARILHAYTEQQASMRVHVAGLFNMVDIASAELSSTETVTLLNDMCFFAPATLIDRRLSWKEVDPLSVEVRFQNGPHSVLATLYFDENGRMVDFSSDDRGALQDDGTLKKIRWSTPTRDYRDIRGHLLPSYGEAVYHYPEGPFAYGKFSILDVEYNVKGMARR